MVLGDPGGFLGVPWEGPWGPPLVWLHRVNVSWGPLGVLWKVLGGPGGFLGVLWGESLEIPARLAAQGARFVGSPWRVLGGPGGCLGVLWGDPWGSPLVWLHRVHVLLSALMISWGASGLLLGCFRAPGCFLAAPGLLLGCSWAASGLLVDQIPVYKWAEPGGTCGNLAEPNGWLLGSHCFTRARVLT